MKKLLSLVLISLLAASVMVGCQTGEGKETKDSETQGSEVNESQSESDSESETEPPVEVIDDGRPEFDGGIILNIDFNSVTFPFLERAVKEENFTKETLYPFVDQYVGTQVKALAFNTFCQSSATPSDVWTDVWDLAVRTEENGIAVDYSKEFVGIIDCFDKRNTDPYEVWIDRCREVGIESWLSIRMNDVHSCTEPTFFVRSDFYYEARANGWLIADGAPMIRHGLLYSYAFDYGVEEVRNRMLAYIEEQINRYDVDGLELDFMREIVCFYYVLQKDCVEIMNDFIRDVKEIVTAAEAKHGHEIKIMVRLARDIDDCLIFGFDAETWDKEGLVDIISPCGRYRSTDNDMPIDEWKARCPNIQISAGIEMNYLREHHNVKVSADMANGLAAAYVVQGADSIYLYNQFVDPGSNTDWRSQSAIKMMNLVGDSDTIFSNRRRHVIFYQEEDVTPVGVKPYEPLPATVAAGKTHTFSLPIGFVQEDKTVRLVMGLASGTPADMTITVNDKVCETMVQCDEAMIDYLRTDTGSSPVADSVTLYSGVIPAESLDRYTITITTTAEVIVDYIEVDIQ